LFVVPSLQSIKLEDEVGIESGQEQQRKWAWRGTKIKIYGS
jgi:hypothetical protein